MVEIVFESHATTRDNQNYFASGHADAELSPLGVRQAKELGERYPGGVFDVVLCSDLRRSYKTAELAFGNRFPIIRDVRLRECDYGSLTGHPSDEVDPEKARRITRPFPDGESYSQVASRLKSFLDDLLSGRDGQRVLIIGHRATQYGLEHWLNRIPLARAVTAAWAWQPGWTYRLEAGSMAGMAYDKQNKLHIVAVTAVIRNEDGKFLVLKRSEREVAHPGKYTFPGGKVEGNESIEEALAEEVHEETGLTMKPGKILLKDASFVRPDDQTVKVLSYFVEVEDAAPVVISDDFTDFRWVDLAELQALPHVGIEEELRQAEAINDVSDEIRQAIKTKSQRDE